MSKYLTMRESVAAGNIEAEWNSFSERIGQKLRSLSVDISKLPEKTVVEVIDSSDKQLFIYSDGTYTYQVISEPDWDGLGGGIVCRCLTAENSHSSRFLTDKEMAGLNELNSRARRMVLTQQRKQALSGLTDSELKQELARRGK